MSEKYKYGFGELEDELINIFSTEKPDFVKAQELVDKGVDIHAISKEETIHNVCSKSIDEYRWSVYEKADENILVQIVEFFLKNGFDVTKYDGVFGAQCLNAFFFAEPGREIFKPMKMLIDAGARNTNIQIEEFCEKDEDGVLICLEGTPWETASGETEIFDWETTHYVNINYACCTIFYALDKGLPYNGIDSYEAAKGKKIIKICAQRKEGGMFEKAEMVDEEERLCFHGEIYMIYNGGALITDGKFFWTDTYIPEELVDISYWFDGIIGRTIDDFYFNEKYWQTEVIMRSLARIGVIYNGHKKMIYIHRREKDSWFIRLLKKISLPNYEE